MLNLLKTIFLTVVGLETVEKSSTTTTLPVMHDIPELQRTIMEAYAGGNSLAQIFTVNKHFSSLSKVHSALRSPTKFSILYLKGYSLGYINNNDNVAAKWVPLDNLRDTHATPYIAPMVSLQEDPRNSQYFLLQVNTFTYKSELILKEPLLSHEFYTTKNKILNESPSRQQSDGTELLAYGKLEDFEIRIRKKNKNFIFCEEKSGRKSNSWKSCRSSLPFGYSNSANLKTLFWLKKKLYVVMLPLLKSVVAYDIATGVWMPLSKFEDFDDSQHFSLASIVVDNNFERGRLQVILHDIRSVRPSRKYILKDEGWQQVEFENELEKSKELYPLGSVKTRALDTFKKHIVYRV